MVARRVAAFSFTILAMFLNSVSLVHERLHALVLSLYGIPYMILDTVTLALIPVTHLHVLTIAGVFPYLLLTLVMIVLSHLGRLETKILSALYIPFLLLMAGEEVAFNFTLTMAFLLLN